MYRLIINFVFNVLTFIFILMENWTVTPLCWLKREANNEFTQVILLLQCDLLSLNLVINVIPEPSGGRQAAISHNIFPFHATLAFSSSGSHEPQPYGLPCHSIWVLRQLFRFKIINLVHWNCDFQKSSEVMQKIYMNFIFKF